MSMLPPLLTREEVAHIICRFTGETSEVHEQDLKAADAILELLWARLGWRGSRRAILPVDPH